MFFSRSPKKLDIQTGYDQWAASYAYEKNPIKSTSDEIIIKMLPHLSGKRVMDAGCGSGYFCQHAEREGAKAIVGIDFSSKMIEQAIKICKYTKFLVDDIQNIDLQESSVDILICALVLGHVEKIDMVISKFSKTLVKDGVLVISDFHPFLSLRGQRRTFRSGKEYLEVPHYIHMLHRYINLLTQSGFAIEQMEEPFWQGNPVIFVLKAKKL
jgi:malonyl-CoA O-methyltransferase